MRGRILQFDGFTRPCCRRCRRKRDEDRLVARLSQVGESRSRSKDSGGVFSTSPNRRRVSERQALSANSRNVASADPSTYAAIISTIQDRGYVTLHQQAVLCGEDRRAGDRSAGGEVRETCSTTALPHRWKGELDQIAEGDRRAGERVLDRVLRATSAASWRWRSSCQRAACVSNEPDGHGHRACDEVRPPSCRSGQARTGVFLGCSGYSLPPKERCTNTMNLVPGRRGGRRRERR